MRHTNQKAFYILSVFLAIFLSISVLGFSTTYYVKPTGNDSNTGLGTTDGIAWQTIGKANSTLAKGDTVYIMAGTYQGQQINPVNATGGTGESDRIIYQNYQTDEPIIDRNYSGDGIDLTSKSYVTVDGIWVQECDRMADIQTCSYITIQNCNLQSSSASPLDTSYGEVRVSNSSYIKLLDNYIRGSDNGDTVMLYPGVTYSLIEGNTVVVSAFDNDYHSIFQLRGTFGAYSRYNVIRDNYFFGGDGLERDDVSSIVGWCEYNLIENNRFDGAKGSGLKFTGARYNIFRRNRSYSNQGAGIHTYSQAGYNACEYTYYYHNTVYNVGDGDVEDGDFRFYGYSNGGDIQYNQVKNNIFYKSNPSTHMMWFHEVDAGTLHDNAYTYNCLYHNSPIADVVYYKGTTYTLAEIEAEAYGFANNIQADPLLTDPTNGDFTLQSGSPCRNAGTWLTTITLGNGSGTSFVVDDARYFMDGYGIVTGDEIQLEGDATAVTITAVNYGTNTITVDESVSWTQGDGVALAYDGSAPDMGAYEFVSGIIPPIIPTIIKTAQVVLNIQANPDFTLQVTPSALDTFVGGTVAYTASVTSINKFVGQVSFVITGVPVGVTVAIVPSDTLILGDGETRAVQIELNIPDDDTLIGTYNLTVIATSNAYN